MFLASNAVHSPQFREPGSSTEISLPTSLLRRAITDEGGAVVSRFPAPRENPLLLGPYPRRIVSRERNNLSPPESSHRVRGAPPVFPASNPRHKAYRWVVPLHRPGSRKIPFDASLSPPPIRRVPLQPRTRPFPALYRSPSPPFRFSSSQIQMRGTAQVLPVIIRAYFIIHLY